MLGYIVNKINYLKKSDVYVLYVGDFTKQIGPPTSMKNLAILLSENFQVATSRNISIAKEVARSKEDGHWSIKRSLFKLIKKLPMNVLLKNIRHLFLLISANIHFTIIKAINPKLIIIITQPVILFPDESVVYIKRANMPVNVSIGKGALFNFFEKRFLLTAL